MNTQNWYVLRGQSDVSELQEVARWTISIIRLTAPRSGAGLSKWRRNGVIFMHQRGVRSCAVRGNTKLTYSKVISSPWIV
jgi:hypothetical protein